MNRADCVYCVTVELEIEPDHVGEVSSLVAKQAADSQNLEPGCRSFEVWTDPVRAAVLFLYEVYDDRTAFDAHLATDHFRRFDRATAQLLKSKSVHFWERPS